MMLNSYQIITWRSAVHLKIDFLDDSLWLCPKFRAKTIL